MKAIDPHQPLQSGYSGRQHLLWLGEKLARRLAARLAPLAAGTAMILLLWLTGGMAVWAAALALVALAGALVLAPQQPISAPPAPAPQVDERPAAPPSVDIASGETSWRAMVSAMPDPALVLDDSGIILHHNAAAADLFPRIGAGQHLSSVSRNPELLSAVEKVSDVADVITVELRDRVPVQRRVSAILTPLPFQRPVEGGPAQLVTFRDITDQERLAQMRADFIAHASHELRTPLASLRGFVETLQGPARDDPEARDRFLGIMAAQAERMTRLIDDLLSLSRIEMHVHVPPRGRVDLNEVVNFVAESLEPVARGAGISIEVETLPTPAFVRGDHDELVQVFQNLIQNAIRYGREGGFVKVRMAREPHGGGGGQRISVAVEDNGEGIAPEHLPRLTERFYRVSVSASRQKGGTGLGLAIVKHIITRHRGELKIASTLGKGSTFTVLLDELAEPVAAPQVAKNQ